MGSSQEFGFEFLSGCEAGLGGGHRGIANPEVSKVVDVGVGVKLNDITKAGYIRRSLSSAAIAAVLSNFLLKPPFLPSIFCL